MEKTLEYLQDKIDRAKNKRSEFLQKMTDLKARTEQHQELIWDLEDTLAALKEEIASKITPEAENETE